MGEFERGGDSAHIDEDNGGYLIGLGSRRSETNLEEVREQFLETLEKEYHSMAGV